jgi:hypothetical protein
MARPKTGVLCRLLPFSVFVLFLIARLLYRATHLHSEFITLKFSFWDSSLTAFFLTDYHSSRIPILHDYIRNRTLPSSVRFEYYFVNYTQESVPEDHFLYPPDKYRLLMPPCRHTRVRHYDLAVKFFFALNFFLQNSTARWFFRGTDDTFINFEALPEYFQGLEQQFKPETEFVFRANCVTNGYQFPQGGSGYLLSRAAARMVEPHCETFMSELRVSEDMSFRAFLAKFGVSMFNVTDEAFSGHHFDDNDNQRLKDRQYHLLDPCPDVGKLARDDCSPFLSPVRQIVFYHEIERTFEQALINVKLVPLVHPALRWWIPTGVLYPKLCFFTGPENVTS